MMGGGGAVRRPIVLVLCLVALAFQSLVVQTHVHAGVQSLQTIGPVIELDVSQGALAHAGNHTNPHGAPPHRHQAIGDCLLCQSALAGVGALPTTLSMGLLEGASISARALERQAVGLDALRSHHWQSRAPPTFSIQ